jgi:hypothetical protein
MLTLDKIFLPNTFTKDKEPKVTSGRNTEIPKRVFICYPEYNNPNAFLKEYFNRPHNSAYNIVTRIDLTDDFIDYIGGVLWTLGLHGHNLSIYFKANSEDDGATTFLYADGAYSSKHILTINTDDLIEYLKGNQCATT